VKSRERDGVRELLDVELYEISPVLHGAHPDARLIGVKSARGGVEFKAASSALSAVRRSRLYDPISCAICAKPAAGSEAPLPSGRKIICTSCLDALDDLAVAAGVITAEQLADAAAITNEQELTSEAEYERAMADEQVYDLAADGTLIEVDDDEGTGRAWRGSGQRW
jgi:hypothetical protein